MAKKKKAAAKTTQDTAALARLAVKAALAALPGNTPPDARNAAFTVATAAVLRIIELLVPTAISVTAEPDAKVTASVDFNEGA